MSSTPYLTAPMDMVPTQCIQRCRGSSRAFSEQQSERLDSTVRTYGPQDLGVQHRQLCGARPGPRGLWLRHAAAGARPHAAAIPVGARLRPATGGSAAGEFRMLICLPGRVGCWVRAGWDRIWVAPKMKAFEKGSKSTEHAAL